MKNALLIGGPHTGKVVKVEGSPTLRIPSDHPLCDEYTRLDDEHPNVWLYNYVGSTLFSSRLSYHPDRADCALALLQLDWNAHVQPVLDALDVTIEGWASGYEVEGYGAKARRGRTKIPLHQEGSDW